MAEKSALSALSKFFKFYPNILILSHMQALRCPCESRCQRSPHANQLGRRRVCPVWCLPGWWCRGRSGSELRDGWRSKQSNSDPRSFQQSILMPCWYPYQHHQKMALLNYQKHISCKLIWTDTLLSGLPEHNIHYSTIHTTQYNTTHF